MAADTSGRIYVADGRNNAVRAGSVLREAKLPKTHGATGVFAAELATFPAPNIESRRGSAAGDHALQIAFARELASGAVMVTSGTARIVDPPTISGDAMSLNLAGVGDAQAVTLTFVELIDASGRPMPDTTLRIGFLLGDSNRDSLVNAADVMQVRNRSGKAVNITNFSSDVNADGSINGADSLIVRAASGRSAP